MSAQKFSNGLQRTGSNALRLVIILFFIVSTLHLQTPQSINAAPAGTALQFDGTNDYVNFGDTRLVSGTLTGAPTWNTAANSRLGDSSLTFNGSTHYVTFGAAPTLNTTDFTLETWFYMTAAGATTSTGTGGVTAVPLVSKGRGESETTGLNVNYFMGIAGTSPYYLAADFEAYAGGGNYPVTATTTAITLNAWHHAAVTYDGCWHLYLDGVSQAFSGTACPNVDPDYTSTQHASLASALTSGGTAAGFFAGRMDEARIWNYARSQAEITGSMNSEILVPTNGLLASWSLNDGSGTTAANINRLGATSFTLESWVYRNAGGATMSTGTGGLEGTGGRPQAYPILAKGMGEGETPANINTNWFLGITSDGFIGADFEDTATGGNHPAWGTTAIPIGAWTHLAATYTGTCWALYVNGVQDTLNALVTACPNATPEASSYQRAALSAGINSTGGLGTGYFSGVIDEARIWNYARSQAEISANLYQELTSGSGLLARWGLNEGSGTTTASSIGTFPGTLTNGPTWVAGFEIPPTEPPASPTGLNATPGGQQITLGWTDNSTNESGFQIERSTTGSGGPFSLLFTTTANVTSYSDIGLLPSTEYCYQVRAVNIAGNSAYTNIACATSGTEPAYALQFDGVDDYVTFGAAPSLNATNFTLETWFYWTGGGVTMTTSGTQGLPSVYPLVAKGRGEADGSNVDTNYFLGIDSTSHALAADFEDMASGMNHPYISSTPVTTNTWHHAAVTYDSVSAVYVVYLDGVIAGTSDLGSNVIPRYDSIQHSSIATALTSTGVAAGYFQGYMDEVRIWNVVRSQAEIRSTINSGLTSGTGLLGRWGMLEGIGTTIASSVGTIQGTLTNGPTWITPGAPFNLTFDTTPPAAPTLLTAVGASGSVTLDWSDNVEPDLSGYNVYRSLTTGGPYSKINSILVTPSTYADSGLINGIEYYYVVRAVDISGNESGNSNEAYAIPNVDLGSALSFTTSGGTYVTFGDPAKLDLATFTIETWFMRTGSGTTTTTGTNGIPAALPLVTHGSQQSEGGTVDANWMLVINDDTDTIGADFEDNATGLNHPVSGVTPIVNGVWYHAAATYDGTTWRLYLNGNLETTLVVGAFTPRSDTTQHAALGTCLQTDGTTTSGFFQGTLDESRVWNRALSQVELLATINQQITSGSGLVARWGMNEGSGTTVGDSILPAANGTIINTNYSWVPGAPFNLALVPNAPTLVSPADLATGVPTTTPLTVHVTDAHNSSLTVSFYGRIKNGPPGTDFTLIAIPDPQYYAATYPSIYNAQMDWITANRTTSNIVFVGSLGDNVDLSTSTTQWTNAQNAWNRLLTNNVPYGLVAGNHDGAPSSTANFNTYIGSQVSTQAAYQGRYGTADYDNTYFFFSGGGMDFVAIFIEYDDTMTSTSHPVLVWANGILQANPNRRAIVLTHNLLNGNSFSTQGLNIYNALRENSNLFLILGGHLDIAGQRSDIYNGNTVYSLRSDYQSQLSQQSGYMRIMRFSPTDDMIYVTTESPLTGVPDLTDTANQFSLPYAMGGGDLFELIGTTTVPAGSDATVTWSGLNASTEYEWYAVSTNTAGSTSSDTWSFTTVGSTNQTPTDLALSPASIAENQPSGTTVGALTSTDPDAGNTFTYTLVSGTGSDDNAFFSISGSNLLTAAVFDFETKSSYSVRIRTTDQGGLYYEEAVTISVTNVNEAPVITEGTSTSVTMSEDGSPTPFSLTLHATDVDASTTLTWSISGAASHGTASASGTGLSVVVGYTPTADYNGSDSFIVRVSDGSLVDTITVNVTINAVNDAPVITGQAALSTLEDTPLTILPGNLTVTDVDNTYPTGFSLTVLPGTNYSVVSPTITPVLNFNGALTVSVQVNDGTANSNIFPLAVTVTPVNDPPTAVDDSTSTLQDTPLDIPVADLLANDTDVDGPSLSVTGVNNPVNGTVALNGATITFTPTAGFTGTAGFDYSMTDGEYSDTGHVTVNVSASNVAPVITEGATAPVTMSEDSNPNPFSLTLHATDFNPADTLTWSISSTASHGTASASGTGLSVAVGYTPTPDYNGSDSFGVQVSDGHGGTDVITVNVTIEAVNDAPVISGQAVLTTPEETALAIILDNLTVTDVDNTYPSGFSLTVLGGSNYTYAGNTITPALNFNGTLTVPVYVNDGADNSNTFDLTVSVTPVNDAPVITAQAVLSTPEDTALTILLTDLSVTDPDDTFPADFTLTVLPGTNYSVVSPTITPALDFNGTLTVPVYVNDGTADSNTFDLAVTISPVNDAPVAVDDNDTTGVDTPLVIAAAILLANDSDVDGPSLSISGVSNPVNGTVGVVDTTITFTPAAGFSGTAGFDYTLTDGSLTDTGHVTILVSAAPLVYSILLQPGWNLISFNIVPTDPAITAVLASIAGQYNLVYAWDGSLTSNNWLHYDPGQSVGNDLLTLTAFQGFWINITAVTPVTLTITGTSPVASIIQLWNNAPGGWNLVSFPSSTSQPLPEALSLHGANDLNLLIFSYRAGEADLWKMYDRAAPAYANDLISLTPGWGYWIKVTGDYDWDVAY